MSQDPTPLTLTDTSSLHTKPATPQPSTGRNQDCFKQGVRTWAAIQAAGEQEGRGAEKDTAKLWEKQPKVTLNLARFRRKTDSNATLSLG